MDIDETLEMIDADRIANDQKLNKTLSISMNKILNNYTNSNFLILKEAKMAVHRAHLKVARKDRVIKGLQKSLRALAAENKALKQMSKGQIAVVHSEAKESESEEIISAETKESGLQKQDEIAKLKKQLKQYKESNSRKSKKIQGFKLILRDCPGYEENEFKVDPDQQDRKPDPDNPDSEEVDAQDIDVNEIDVAELMDPDSDEREGNDPNDPDFDIDDEPEEKPADTQYAMLKAGTQDADESDESEQRASQMVDNEEEDIENEHTENAAC